MSKQYKCPHCGFVGYPEIARREKKGKLFLGFLWDVMIFFSKPRAVTPALWRNLFISYHEWDNFSAEKHLRCAHCKQPLFLDELEEQPLPAVHHKE